MLPSRSSNGVRLAGVLPSLLSKIEQGELRTAILVVVDGLGWHNLQERRGYARTLSRLESETIDTVVPSTTGAALTTITTGTLPGAHGLVGYRVRHPEYGVLTTLTDWSEFGDVREWQRSTTVFERAIEMGVSPVVIARPAHRTSGFTRGVLTGAEYLTGQTMAERFDRALSAVRGGSRLVYLYVDELDRVGHRDGWQSDAWLTRLEELDGLVATLVRQLPADVGFALTADHGMVDVPREHHLVMHEGQGALEGVTTVAGEPRFRHLYVEHPDETLRVRDAARSELGESAWVFTRDEAIASGLFGDVASEVAPRIGDVMLAARTNLAVYLASDDPLSRDMVGQHGSLTAEEREIPLLTQGVEI